MTAPLPPFVPSQPPRMSSRTKLALAIGGSAAVLVSCCTGLGVGAAGSDSSEAAPKTPRETVTETVTATVTVTVTVTPSPVPTTPPPASLQPFAGAPAKPPAVKPAPVRKPAAPKPPPEPASAYYANCSAARAAGVTPLYRGDAGYRAGLDRDGDGVACE